MNPKISNEIDNILNESEQKHSSDSKSDKGSLFKRYILRIILGLLLFFFNDSFTNNISLFFIKEIQI